MGYALALFFTGLVCFGAGCWFGPKVFHFGKKVGTATAADINTGVSKF